MPKNTTSETIKHIRSHLPTASFYEDLGLVTKAERIKHNPHLYTNLHLHQMNLVKTALNTEVHPLHLIKKFIKSLELCAKLDFDGAIKSAREYSLTLSREIDLAHSSITVLAGGFSPPEDDIPLKRNEVAKKLFITADTMRNWELNELIDVDRDQNGYRIYKSADLAELGVIRALRAAGYSLGEISGMMTDFSLKKGDDKLLAICRGLLKTLESAKADSEQMLTILRKIKQQFNELK